MSQLSIVLAKKYITHEFPAQVEKYFLSTLTPEKFTENLADHYLYYVAISSQQLAGFIGIKNHSHLFHLFVAENMQRQGIATRLWELTKQNALEVGKIHQFSVNASVYAEPLYKKLGFKPKSAPIEKNGIITIPMTYQL